MGKKHRLSNEEVDRVVDKIRAKYDDYIIRYMKRPDIKNGFESRYLDVRRAGTDPQSFLSAEIAVIEELIHREEEKRRTPKGPGKKKGPKRESFADRIMAEHRKQIEKYPDLKLPGGASFETKKIFGMLQVFDREIWPNVTRLFGNSRLSITYDERNRLEVKESELCVSRKDGFPPALTRYVLLVTKDDKDWEDIEFEERNLVLQSAFFLHQVDKLCTNLREGEHLSEEDEKRVDKIQNFLHIVINDFRLFDLKPME